MKILKLLAVILLLITTSCSKDKTEIIDNGSIVGYVYTGVAYSKVPNDVYGFIFWKSKIFDGTYSTSVEGKSFIVQMINDKYYITSQDGMYEVQLSDYETKGGRILLYIVKNGIGYYIDDDVIFTVKYPIYKYQN